MSNMKVKDMDGSTVDLLEVDGYRLPAITDSPEQGTEIFRNIPKFPCRDDDILLCASIKAGTHWLWEILGMLISGKAENTKKGKPVTMLENLPASAMDDVPSPRILNTHVSVRYLPQQALEGKCKIILLLRNPKDMLVSWYNHSKGFRCYHYDGKWENFLEMFLQDKLEYCSWFDYVLDWEKLMKERPELPIYTVMYEDLKMDLEKEIRRLANWLSFPADDALVKDIADKCTFKSMVRDKVYPENVRKRIFKKDFAVYRKGEVGDWQNWFTVAQNEKFDAVYEKKMKGSQMTFKYIL